MTVSSFADVQKFFSGIDASQAPHGNFWNQSTDPKESYDLFVKGDVPGGSATANPDTGQPLPILIVGDGEHSNIIYALRGTAGTFWDKNNPNSAFGQMPYNGPYFTDAQIDELRDWINNKCPELAAGTPLPSGVRTPPRGAGSDGSTSSAVDGGVTMMAINSFADVQKFFSAINVGGYHGNFWSQSTDPRKSYDLFVNGNVPGGSETADPNTGQPLKILIIGDGDHSNIIYALHGTTGTFWDKNNPNSAFGQMPYNGPYFTDAQIDELRDWINNKCPE